METKEIKRIVEELKKHELSEDCKEFLDDLESYPIAQEASVKFWNSKKKESYRDCLEEVCELLSTINVNFSLTYEDTTDTWKSINVRIW